MCKMKLRLTLSSSAEAGDGLSLTKFHTAGFHRKKNTVFLKVPAIVNVFSTYGAMCLPSNLPDAVICG